MIRIERAPEAARKVLESRPARDTTPAERVFIAFIEGLIALEERRERAAADILEETLDMIAEMQDDVTWGGLELSVKAYTCIANAESGAGERARSLLVQVVPYLQAHKETELLERCRAAVAAAVP